MPCLSFVDSWAWMPRMKKYVSGLIGMVCLASVGCSCQGGLVSWLLEGGIVPTYVGRYVGLLSERWGCNMVYIVSVSSSRLGEVDN